MSQHGWHTCHAPCHQVVAQACIFVPTISRCCQGHQFTYMLCARAPLGGMGRSVHVPTMAHLHYVFKLAVSQHPPRQPGYTGPDVGCIPELACCGTGSPCSSTTTWWQKHTACSTLQCFIPCGSVATLICTPTVSQHPGSTGMPVYTRAVLCGSVCHTYYVPSCCLCVCSCLSACCFPVLP